MEEIDSPNDQSFTPLVEQVLKIEDVTLGPPAGESTAKLNGKVIVRYRGRLLQPREAALARLSEGLLSHNISPILTQEDGRDSVLLVEDPYIRLIEPVFQIEEIIWGAPPPEASSLRYRQEIIARYRGRLRIGSEEAYDVLVDSLRPIHTMPMLREAGGLQEIALVRRLEESRPPKPWINLLLFVLTVVSVLFAGAIYAYSGPVPDGMIPTLQAILGDLAGGIPFAAGLMSILLAHEFGHYLAGRYHGARVTLPYFIPFPYPFSIIGTMGAFIQLKAPTKNKKALFDLGAAGPLAGLVVALVVLLAGLSLSDLDRIPLFARPGEAFTLEGNSVIYLLAKFAVFRELLPEPLTFAGTPPALYWLRYFFTGFPTPLGATDVILHPLAWAGWVGLLVTALNLIPAGQLDGGHVIYTLFGARARVLWPFIIVALLLLGIVWRGWWIWAGLVFVLGRFYAEPMDQITPLNRRRKVLAVITLLIFLLVFSPVPIRIISSGGIF
jgi:membrane-associated protease RseP (regulator of RpoE activity)